MVEQSELKPGRSDIADSVKLALRQRVMRGLNGAERPPRMDVFILSQASDIFLSRRLSPPYILPKDPPIYILNGQNPFSLLEFEPNVFTLLMERAMFY